MTKALNAVHLEAHLHIVHALFTLANLRSYISMQCAPLVPIFFFRDWVSGNMDVISGFPLQIPRECIDSFIGLAP